MKDDKLLIKPYLFMDYEDEYNKMKHKTELLNIVIDGFSKIKTNLDKFNRIMENKIIKDKSSSFGQEEFFYELLLLIKNSIEMSFKENNLMVNKILEQLTEIRDLIKIHFKKYEDFFDIQKIFTNKLVEIEENKNNFFKSAKKAEEFTYEFLEKKVHSKETTYSEFQQKEDLQKNAKTELEEYKKKINECNEELKSFNEKQTDLFEVNKILESSYGKTYNDTLNTFSKYQSILMDYFKQIKTKPFDDSYLKRYEELLKKKKNEIPFAQYKTNIDFHNSKDDVNLYTYFMVFNEMERQIGKYTENDYLTEQEKINLTEKINRILYLNEKITDKDYEELEGYLKTDLGQKTFLLLLSTLRSNGKYEKAKIFIELIGKALNLILESAEKEANYDKAKNCLILSQTFFYYDINKEKIYIFIFIQDNKWIKGISFWREFIDLMINREVQKIGNLTDRKMNDVLLTQVLPFVNNMKDLHIDNKNIVKVIDEIIEKYHVKDEDIKDALFSLISSDKKVIEELRNEYKKIEN
jgi:hypothetical protein